MYLLAGRILGQGPGPVGDVRVALRSRKALVAEDNATVRVLVETIVRDLGFDVTTVSGGAEAQSRLFVERPDLFIVDLLLPTVSGQLLIRTLKAIKRDARIIAISGMDGDAQVDALKAGADVFLSKPFARADLERVITELYQ